MGRKSGWRKSPMCSGAGVGLLFLLGLLCGCSSTGGKDTTSGDLSDFADIADAVPKVEPKSKYGNPESYVVFGKRYYTKTSSEGYVERGIASWYGRDFHGRKTSSGERYDMYAMTAAHKTLPLPSYARVTNVSNGRSAVVKINDRGPFHGSRAIDLSYSAARKLGVVAKGTAMVEIRTIDPRRPQTEIQDNFFASNGDALEAATPARKKAVVALATPPAKRSTPRAEETRTLVATAKKPDAPAPDRPMLVAETAETSAPATKVATASIVENPRKVGTSAMYLQVGAFGNRVNAEKLRRRLVSHIAEQVQVRMMNGTDTSWYKVHVGPLESRKSAQDLSQRLASLGVEGSHVVVQ